MDPNLGTHGRGFDIKLAHDYINIPAHLFIIHCDFIYEPCLTLLCLVLISYVQEHSTTKMIPEE